MKPDVLNINCQPSFGGGEVYTRFLIEACQKLGHRTSLIHTREAEYWRGMGLRDVAMLAVSNEAEILAAVAATPPETLVVTHTFLTAETTAAIARLRRLGGIAHMPQNDRRTPALAATPLTFGVSAYVVETLGGRAPRVHAEPLYAIADLKPRSVGEHEITRRSEYDWDKRKLRDRVLSWAHTPPADERWMPHAGLTLGIVSRITPIKQFPQLFSFLAPLLAQHSNMRLEIFGSGGYASVRDCKRALAPAAAQVRWWGHQSDPAQIYPKLDALLTGLPEKEALGLNLIEAIACGTPVLAVNAPPFTETVIDGENGFLYTDPRKDDGQALAALLSNIANGSIDNLPKTPSQTASSSTSSTGENLLTRFSQAAFEARVARMLDALQGVSLAS
jgi:glycosyltransferase involved in cell wall biosynthesis